MVRGLVVLHRGWLKDGERKGVADRERYLNKLKPKVRSKYGPLVWTLRLFCGSLGALKGTYRVYSSYIGSQA